MARPKKAYVYRYVDLQDGIIKYVGIVHKSDLFKRLSAHASKDDWYYKGNWKIEYFECDNRSEAEAFESHLISLYGTDKYYNKAKKKWGINKYLPDVEDKWMLAQDSHFESLDAYYLSLVIRKLIRDKRIKEALSLLDCLEIRE